MLKNQATDPGEQCPVWLVAVCPDSHRDRRLTEPLSAAGVSEPFGYFLKPFHQSFHCFAYLFAQDAVSLAPLDSALVACL
jgi:hypothetical protein